jgi:hypothetical protein
VLTTATGSHRCRQGIVVGERRGRAIARDMLRPMRGALGRLLVVAVVVLALVAVAAPARADEIDDQVALLAGGGGYKIRLGAALSLSKSRDPRAVTALAVALERDSESTIRRVAALSLGQLGADLAKKSRERAQLALEKAARADKDARVRDTATEALAKLSGAAPATADGPSVFVNVGGATDLTRKAPADAARRLEGAVRSTVKRTGYAVEWPGGLPTMNELAQKNTQGFFVAATVAVLDIDKTAARAEVACTVSIRVAPWQGKDGKEKWEASRAASAKGSGKAITGGSDAAVAGGIRDCILTVGEELTARQVVPFIKRLAANP